jgi:hypothetical protein
MSWMAGLCMHCTDINRNSAVLSVAARGHETRDHQHYSIPGGELVPLSGPDIISLFSFFARIAPARTKVPSAMICPHQY